jgi:hypothetical protein
VFSHSVTTEKVQIYIRDIWHVTPLSKNYSVQTICLFFKTSRPVPRPTLPPIPCFPGVKLPGREVKDSPPSMAKFKNDCSYTSAVLNAFMVRTGTICFYWRTIEWGKRGFQTFLNCPYLNKTENIFPCVLLDDSLLNFGVLYPGHVIMLCACHLNC